MMSDSTVPSEDLPPELYKFRPYATPLEQGRIEEILLGHRVFIPSPSTFNDPFDPRPKYAIRSREKALYHFQKKARKEFGRDSDIERQMLKADLHAGAAEVTQKYRSIFREESGVLSLTGTREPILLWSHYAANHTGLCVHFSGHVAPFILAIPVRYTDDYPVIGIPFDTDYTEQFMQTLCTKARIWEYEKEFRLARLPESLGAPNFWHAWDGRHMIIPPEAITGITMGALMSDVSRAKLYGICSQRVPTIELWRAELHESQFALTFTRLN